MGEIIERPVRGAAFHAEGEWAIPEGYEAEIKDGKIIVRKKASEDERNWEEVLSYIKDDALRIWLEKQKEQKHVEFAPNQFDGIAYGMGGHSTDKPAGWSEKESAIIDGIIQDVRNMKMRAQEDVDYPASREELDAYDEELDFLNRLKSRRPVKQEFSEGDEKMIDKIVENLTELKNRYNNGYGRVGDCIAWLEARRPQAKQKQTSEEE